MDSRQPDANMAGMQDDVDDQEGDEEVEVTREELIAAMQEVVTDLSEGLRGSDRDAYLDADDLAQNDWFFAGASDRPGQYAVTMWPAEGDEDMLRIDIGSEDDVHNLASSPDQIAALTDDFIEGLSEEYDEELDEEEEYDEEEELDEEEYDEELDEEYDEEYEEDLEDEVVEEGDDVSRNGRR
jgi:hypothetical protein